MCRSTISRSVPAAASGSSTRGTVDFGASDMPMTDDAAQEFRSTARCCTFPTVLGAVVPTYNVPGVSGDLNFTPEALAGIFLGTITKWNDPAIAKAEHRREASGGDIVVVHRSDGSGTTYIWTDFLSKVSADWKTEGRRGHFGELAGGARRQRERGRGRAW